MSIPNPDLEEMDILEYQMEPGDAVAFHFETLHGSRGNNTKIEEEHFH